MRGKEGRGKYEKSDRVVDAVLTFAEMKEILASGQPLGVPACVISGGETTVTIRGQGLGGRNQEFCLAAALDLRDLPPRVVVLSGGTDGNDGPTPVAGAIVDQTTLAAYRRLRPDYLERLERYDSHTLLSSLPDALIETGNTRTNVGDVMLFLFPRPLP
jgi:hydroxypyruvate reductase